MLLIDGDIICYRTAFSKEAESIEDMLSIADSYVTSILTDADDDLMDYCVYITGKGNYRDDVAVTAPYKGNRPSKKPEGLQEIRKHLLEAHPSQLAEGEEADDLIAIAATRLKDNCVICTIDKDMDQIPGKHYNFVKKLRYTVTEEAAIRFFYRQLLTGDSVDNIIGLYGIGPKKAEAALQECKTELEMYRKCLEMYDNNEQRVIENGRLLWLRREEDQVWAPPLE